MIDYGRVNPLRVVAIIFDMEQTEVVAVQAHRASKRAGCESSASIHQFTSNKGQGSLVIHTAHREAIRCKVHVEIVNAAWFIGISESYVLQIPTRSLIRLSYGRFDNGLITYQSN